jgi:hypothetical protein
MESSAKQELITASQRLDALAGRLFPYHIKYERERDARAVFAYVYYNMTADLKESLESSSGRIQDSAWVASLAEAFGNRFISAMDALDACLEQTQEKDALKELVHATVPCPWGDVYLAICGNQSFVLEDLIYSMMAHISYDLPNALLAVANDPSRLTDYHRMNDLLASRIEQIGAEVGRRYSHGILWLEHITGRFGDFLTNYGIRTARSVAWYNAMRLQDPSARREAKGSIERSTSLLITSARHPKLWWLNALVSLLRFIIPRGRKWPARSISPESVMAPEVRARSRWRLAHP